MQAAIFDVDGVLVATRHERAWREALEELMAADWRAISPHTAYAAHRFTTMVYREHVAGKPRESGARAILEFFEVPDPRERTMVYAQRKQQHIDRFIDEGAFEAYPDALRFVISLSERGIRLGVASSSRNSMVVEDATAGVQAAKRGGMRALGVARLDDEALLLLLAAGADLVAASLDEVDSDRLQQGFLERRPCLMQASTSAERRTSR